ncbi:hypothetical protein J2S74_003044 [Evansella vedderi]|uniref:Uncharacterized protein n=1 Tax=Evansella vedderi TaxID=38282 RepID=A0ABT9ZWQ1_9BACI|nr:hypothetical protein [Evansella vedderi]MDQ0255662.1 hypothetical protein [Evansella vedderi]
MNWIIKAKHLNDEKKVIGLEIEDEDGTFDANIKWDGSMEINIKSRTEENVTLTDTIHTYDIDGLIYKLESLKQTCYDYFDGWNDINENRVISEDYNGQEGDFIH